MIETDSKERVAAPSGSVMRWTRSTIFKVRCVIAEMREAREWVGRIRSNPGVSSEDDRECRRTMVRIIRKGHWWKLRSLAKELPLALVLDTPGLRTIWRRWKKRKHSQNAERIHGDDGAGKPRETLPPLDDASC